MSSDEFDRMIPVKPPTVKRNINPITHSKVAFMISLRPNIVAIQLKTLIPVGTAMIMVAEVK